MSARGTSWTREAGLQSHYEAASKTLIEGESEPAPVGPEGKRREGKGSLSPDLDLLRRFDYTVRKQDPNQEPDESKFLQTNFKLPGLGEMLFNKLGKWENKISYQGNSPFGVHTPNRLSVLSQSNTSTLSPMTPRDRSKVRWEGSNILQAHVRRALKQREYNTQQAYRRWVSFVHACLVQKFPGMCSCSYGIFYLLLFHDINTGRHLSCSHVYGALYCQQPNGGLALCGLRIS